MRAVFSAWRANRSDAGLKLCDIDVVDRQWSQTKVTLIMQDKGKKKVAAIVVQAEFAVWVIYDRGTQIGIELTDWGAKAFADGYGGETEIIRMDAVAKPGVKYAQVE